MDCYEHSWFTKMTVKVRARTVDIRLEIGKHENNKNTTSRCPEGIFEYENCIDGLKITKI